MTPMPVPPTAAPAPAPAPARALAPVLAQLQARRRAGAAALALALLAAPAAAQAPWPEGAPNRPGIGPEFPGQTEAPAEVTPGVAAPQVLASGLAHPWGVAVLPGAAGYLVTERPGRLRHVARDGTVSAPIAGVPEVLDRVQGGLLDVALAPDFETSRVLYLTYARPLGLARAATAAARAVLSEDLARLEAVTEIFVQDPPSRLPIHYGSRVLAPGDGTVLISVGERGGTEAVQALAQETGATYGGVVRMTEAGAPAPGNPFAGAGDGAALRLTLGQRNPQGLAQEPGRGRVWTVEHGPAGGDELNLVEPGANYGWPLRSYGTTYRGGPVGDGSAAHAPDFTPPRYYWDPVIAPGGMVVYAPPAGAALFPDWEGDLLIAGLQAQAVVRLALGGPARDVVRAEERLAEGIGRVRDVAVDHDGAVLFLTDDPEDGRLYRLGRE